jgi:L-iditol 2-dehydrogenase
MADRADRTDLGDRIHRALALVYSGAGASRLDPVVVPPAAPGEVVVALGACGLCGTDLHKLQHDAIAPGTVLGHELVGRVDEVGEGVSDLAVGDRVVVPHHVACGSCDFCVRDAEPHCSLFRENLLWPGGFAERVVVRERAVRRALRRIPDDLGDDDALFLEPIACVVRAVRASGLLVARPVASTPSVAVVLGGGSVGLLHVLVLTALAKNARVAVIDPLPDRRRLAQELGAAAVAAPGTPVAALLSVLEARALGGVDAVFDCVGGAGTLADGLALARPGGAVVLFAHGREGERSAFELNPFFKSEQRVVASYSSGLEDQRRAFELLASGRVRPGGLISHRLPLTRFDEGVALARGREALKVVFAPDADETLPT